MAPCAPHGVHGQHEARFGILDVPHAHSCVRTYPRVQLKQLSETIQGSKDRAYSLIRKDDSLKMQRQAELQARIRVVYLSAHLTTYLPIYLHGMSVYLFYLSICVSMYLYTRACAYIDR